MCTTDERLKSVVTETIILANRGGEESVEIINNVESSHERISQSDIRETVQISQYSKIFYLFLYFFAYYKRVYDS